MTVLNLREFEFAIDDELLTQFRLDDLDYEEQQLVSSSGIPGAAYLGSSDERTRAEARRAVAEFFLLGGG